MKKRFLRWGFLALSMLWLYAGAQVTINRAEYFYDTDPGVGNGTAVTAFTAADSVNLNLTLPTTGLPTGIHYAFVRFRYNNGTWGLHSGASFYVFSYATASAAKINRAEYFFDTDPGVGNGTGVAVSPATDSANISLAVSTTGLSQGLHNLFFRFRYDDGTWGLQEGRSLYILMPTALGNTAKIDRAEYFYDTDPGLGNGTAIPVSPATDSANLTFTVATTGLGEGLHNLFVRFRYDNGTWGLHEGRTLYILPTASIANNATIASAEYFYDTDPGLGNGTAIAIPTAADSVNLSLTPSLTGLNAGYHNLFIRFKYDNGTWGLYEGRPFYILPVAQANTAKIDLVEYFFDNDPGIGRGTAIPVTPATDTANLLLTNINITGLSSGTHNLFFRFRYDNGTWGLYEGRAFSTCTPPPATITAGSATTYCIGSSVTLTANTGVNYTYQWQRNGLNIQDATTSTYTVTDTSGNYNVVVSANNCDGPSNSIVVYVGQPVTTPLTAGICSGASYNFNGDILTAEGTYRDTLSSFAGCDSIVVLTLSVSALPTVTLTGNPDSVCNDAASITLTGGTPSGGTYSGTGVTSGSFDPTNAGLGVHVITYTYDNAGCAASAEETIVVKDCDVVGIEETPLASSFKLYPNPVENELVVESAWLNEKGISITLFDASGRLIEVNYKRQTNRIVFQAGKLPAGIYSLRFALNGEVVSKRFMKVD